MRHSPVLLVLCTALAAQSAAPTLKPLFAGFETGLNCEQPQLAVRQDGAQALVFVAGGTSVRIAIRLNGQEWQAPSMVAELPLLAYGNHRGPRVAWAGDALLVACIESRFDSKTRTMGGSGNLTLRRSTDLGAHWSQPLTINSENGCAREGLHAIAASGEQAALVWIDLRAEPRTSRIWCALSQDGGATFGKDFLAHGAKEPICPCCHPSLCIDGKGRAVVMWRDAIDGNRDLYTGVITGQGKAIAGPQAASPGRWKLAACPMDGGGLGLASDGKPISVWRREDAIFWAMAGREHRLGSGRNPTLGMGAGNSVLAAWESAGKVATARFDTAQPDKVEPGELGAGAFPSIAALTGGRFTVVAEMPAGGRTRIGACDL